MTTTPIDQATIDTAYAVFAQAPLLLQVHGPEYLNVGWHPADNPQAALVDRLLDAADPETPPAVILDVACGRAASTTRIAARWPAAQVIGLDRNAALLPPQGRADSRSGPGSTRAPELSGRRGLATPPAILRGDATTLPLATGSVDLLCSIEAALHFPTRQDFFAEAARVLRPGGRLILTDLLVDPASPGWAPMVPAANDQQNLHEYGRALAAADFGSCRIADITAQTWRPYMSALIAAAAADSADAGHAVARLLNERPVAAYVEVVAQR